ncbi:uncharacterized protein BDCG_16715, partial [Blastomyces dermatitidis ER-3]
LATSVSRSCGLFLIWLAFCVHPHKETFTILHHSFTNFSHSSIIIFIIVIIKCHHLIQDFYLFFCSTLSICSSITLYMFLAMTPCSHSKCHCSAHTEQFISKSSHVDRFMSADDSEPDVVFLIKNLKNVIMKKLFMSCVTESSVSSLASSVTSFSAASFSVPFSATSQSPTLAPVSGSPTPATPVPATPGFTASAFVTSSPCFKKMLYIKKLFITVKFNITEISALTNSFEMIDLYWPILWCLLSDFVMQVKDICVFRNENADVILFYTCECEACTPCLRCCCENELFACCVLLSAFLCVPLSLSEKPCACFAPAPEAILIEDDNITETTLFCL